MTQRVVVPELRRGGVFRKASQAEESIDKGKEGNIEWPGSHLYMSTTTDRREGRQEPQARLKSLGPSRHRWGPGVSHLISGEPGVP